MKSVSWGQLAQNGLGKRVTKSDSFFSNLQTQKHINQNTFVAQEVEAETGWNREAVLEVGEGTESNQA